jgi:hypothetical protein
MTCTPLMSPLTGGKWKFPLANVVFVHYKLSTGGSPSQCGHIVKENPSALVGTFHLENPGYSYPSVIADFQGETPARGGMLGVCL